MLSESILVFGKPSGNSFFPGSVGLRIGAVFVSSSRRVAVSVSLTGFATTASVVGLSLSLIWSAPKGGGLQNNTERLNLS